jgi:zinc D-Ala-D-Ala carboxypeptidase
MVGRRPPPYGRAMSTITVHRTGRISRVTAWALVAAGVALVGLPALDRVGAMGSLPGPVPPASLPACGLGDVPAEADRYSDWADTLLDTTHALERGYVPPDLAPALAARPDVRLRAFVVPDLLEMLRRAREDGVEITLVSGYRSYDQQGALFRHLAAAEGEESALLTAARAGHSEHQLGTTVDLQGGAGWLKDNAWRFGFAMSYPPGRSPQWSCYRAEPWHYRYFGRRRAAQIHESGLSPREWLWQRRGSGR